jgi:hypothetical protein
LAELDNRWQLPEDGSSLERQIRSRASASHGLRELPSKALAAEDAAAAHNPYHDWIETHAASEFEDLAATLEGLLERQGKPLRGRVVAHDAASSLIQQPLPHGPLGGTCALRQLS